MKLYYRYLLLTFIVIILLTKSSNAQTTTMSAFHVGLVYPISNHGSSARDYSNAFSLHGIAGLSGEERGVAISGISTIVKGKAKGFVVSGLTNTIGDAANGFIVAGLLNTYQSATGFQTAGLLNLAEDSVNGFTAAGLLNTMGNAKGFQAAGLLNTAVDINGVTVAGLINIYKEGSGTQVAGLLNTASNIRGAQIAGLLNKANDVRGTQIGFINIANTNRYPIGLINLIKDGEKAIGITTDDNQTTLVTFRSGSSKMYGILGVGMNLKNETEVIAVQFGLGAHLFSTNWFRVKAELYSTRLDNYKKVSADKRGEFYKHSLAVLPTLRLGKFEMFAGPSINMIETDSGEGRKLVGNFVWSHRNGSNNLAGIYVGYTGGIHVKF